MRIVAKSELFPPLPGRKVGKQICEALDLDPNDVQRIFIDLEANGAARVTVEMLVRDGIARRIGTIVKGYSLVEEP